MGDNNSKIKTICCKECKIYFERDWRDEILNCKGCKVDVCRSCYKKSNRCDNCGDFYCKFCRHVLIVQKCKNCKIIRCNDCATVLNSCCREKLSRLEQIKRAHMLFQIEKKSGMIM